MSLSIQSQAFLMRLMEQTRFRFRFSCGSGRGVVSIIRGCEMLANREPVSAFSKDDRKQVRQNQRDGCFGEDAEGHSSRNAGEYRLVRSNRRAVGDGASTERSNDVLRALNGNSHNRGGDPGGTTDSGRAVIRHFALSTE